MVSEFGIGVFLLMVSFFNYKTLNLKFFIDLFSVTVSKQCKCGKFCCCALNV